jgi:hypothetical protein
LLTALLLTLLLRLRCGAKARERDDEKSCEEQCRWNPAKISRHLRVSLPGYGRRLALLGFVRALHVGFHARLVIRPEHPDARGLHRISLNRRSELNIREIIQCV